jgi:hypothetical protein
MGPAAPWRERLGKAWRKGRRSVASVAVGATSGPANSATDSDNEGTDREE